MRQFWLCFVPIFVAVDVIGTMPIYLGMIEGIEERKVRRILVQSVVTALVVALAFLFIGEAVFKLLGITFADFMVAGGVLLFVIAMGDIVGEKTHARLDPVTLGAVPLGVPFIVGPAALASMLLSATEYGKPVAVLASTANILLAGLVLRAAKTFLRLMGKAGTRTFSKVANLVLAAIAVMMVRKGIAVFLGR